LTFNNPGIGTEFLAHREKIEVTRYHSTSESLSGAGGTAASPHHVGYFGVLRESSPEIGTRWRSEMNSNRQYRLSSL
jgi:hypothetical protein